jgi:hypothetical protein
LFDSKGKQTSIGTSLAAVFGVVQDVKLDRSVMDHASGAVPNIRVADDSMITRKLDEVACLVGTERFYLKVGEMLYRRGAEVGLRPDGLITKSENEQLEEGKIIDEQIQEVNERSRHVFNPAIGEFVAMMGQIDEFKRIRTRIKEAAISENLSPQDVDKLDKDVKNFLDDPEVKNSFDSLEKTDEKLDDCLVRMAELEAAQEGQSIPQTVGDGGAHYLAAEYGANLQESHLFSEYATVEAQKNSIVHDCLKHVTTVRRRSEEFAEKHPIWTKIGSVALQGAGYLGLAGIIKAGLKLGGKKAVAFIGANILSQEVIAAAIENGTEALIDRAISCANTEQEAVEFAKTAVWAMETALAGAAVVGVAGLIKDKAAVSSKLAVTKVNVSAAARAKFVHKQVLRSESTKILSAIAEEKITAKIKQRTVGNAGAYKELTRGAPKGGFQDGKEAHHIPSKAFMEKHGVSKDEGLAIMMTEEQHKKTRTYKFKKPEQKDPRSELAKDLSDVRKILKEDGDHTPEVNKKLLDSVRKHENRFKDVFKKEE